MCHARQNPKHRQTLCGQDVVNGILNRDGRLNAAARSLWGAVQVFLAFAPHELHHCSANVVAYPLVPIDLVALVVFVVIFKVLFLY